MNIENINLNQQTITNVDDDKAKREAEKLLLESQLEEGDIAFDENIEIRLDVQEVSSDVNFNEAVPSQSQEQVNLGTEQTGNITF